MKQVKAGPQATLDALYDELMALPADELERISKDKKASGLKKAIARILYKAGVHGDTRRLEPLLTRRYGKPQSSRPDEDGSAKETEDGHVKIYKAEWGQAGEPGMPVKKDDE